MADVRSMLRAERVKRRITHPHASYTKDGQLLCNLCETFVKDEAHWGGHLHSTGHALRSKRKEDAAATRSAESLSGNETKRKRKADEIESSPPDDRKKVKGDDSEALDVNAPDVPKEDEAAGQGVEEQPQVEGNTAPTKVPPTEGRQSEMDEQFAAFERDIAALEDESGNAGPISLSALNAEASISAAPTTSEQLAAASGDDASAQRGKRDAELEAEREDAARILEDEFDEMQGYEERARKLREKREALRNEEVDAGNTKQEIVVTDEQPAEQPVEEDDSESDYDDDDWNFRPG